jgi:Outer membrane lipoprotein-sorting protein
VRTGPLALAASLAAFTVLQMPAHAAVPTGPLAAARRQVEEADYSAKGRLIHVDGDGHRTSYGISIKAHWFPGVLRVLLAVTSPAGARENVLFEMRPDGPDSIQIARPGDTGPAVLPFSKWAGGPLGDGFSYEDFLDETYFWPGQRDLGNAKYGARLCDQLLSTPGEADKTHFASVKSWVDQTTGLPVYVEKTMKESGSVKEFTSFGLRHADGVWSATQVEEKTRGRAGSTLLIIDRGTARAHLKLKDFNLTQLIRF